MIFEGIAGMAEIIILALMMISVVIFAIMDIRTREVENKWMKLYLGVMIVPVILAYIFDYIPNLQWWCIFYVIIAILIPFLWFRFMPKWIGAADCKWLMITFVALPEFILVFVVLMIIFTLINYLVYRIRGCRDLMPEMVPIGCSALIICILNIIVGVMF